jgi:hypothetical protein
MAVICKRLGHADASITAPIYAHFQDDALRAAKVGIPENRVTCTDARGPGWDRTSDLPRVKRTLFH